MNFSISEKMSATRCRSFCRVHFVGVVFVWIFVAAVLPPLSHAQSSAVNSDKVPLADVISGLRQENSLVGLAAMVMVDGKVVESAVDGERKTDSGVKLEIGDRWHLGSITKSITATMIGRLVESGQMQWTDTVGKCFPNETVHEDWKPVTVRQLLTHTSGAPSNFSIWVQLKHPELGPECTSARRKTVLGVVSEKLTYTPGEKHSYSNVGYTIAGAMAEETTGMAWEDLVRREVFEPLKLSEAGFGPPKSSDENVEQPRGHTSLLGWKVAVADDDDNTPIIGPAGTVHMPLRDVCVYATEHMRGNLGAGKLLSAHTYKQLHTPELEDYACGWVKIEKSSRVPHTIYWHNGSNTMWYALVVFVPEKKLVVAVTSNDGATDIAEAAAWEVVGAYVPTGKYPKKSPFAAVRWKESQPEVKLGNEWFKLVSLNELPSAEIVAFSKQTYGDKWRMRFEEDLVELLTEMKQPPQNKVTLVVESLTSGETSILTDVPMTNANREAIRNAHP